MNREQLTNDKLFIIDGQLTGTVLYIVTLIISIIIVYDQRRKALGKDEILTSKESQDLALINRIVIFILIIWFLYLNYKSKELAVNTNQDTSSLNLQILSSYISIIPALIGIYVVATNFSNTNLQTSEIENPFN